MDFKSIALTSRHDYAWLRPSSSLGCRRAEQDATELQTQNPAEGRGGKKEPDSKSLP